MLDILLILIIILIILLYSDQEDFLNYKRCKNARGITKEVLDEYGANKSDDEWQLLLPVVILVLNLS